MSEPRHATFYLEDGLRQSAEAGEHNFLTLLAGVLRAAGFDLAYRPDTEEERAASAGRPGYALFHMAEPTHDRALTLRRVYHYPFWAIEPSARRWDWRVAKTAFAADAVPRREADRFYRFWQSRLFADAPQNATREGFVYVPLQGRLLQHRSFQGCAPLDMLRAVLAHDPRPVIAALHPKESYSEDELTALDRLEQATPRLTVTLGGMERWLGGCDYVVTENSSAAFNGYLFGKPAVLFARADFHHIAADAIRLGAEQALRAATDLRPDYAGYLHWFWQDMAINAGRPEATGKIHAALLRAGWPV
ncbi:hypothetical protein [Antarcticimicrobium luteum]|uniref:Capsular polysaccharide biosynthesis protein n=1 Tax=Antarcticimicrobium luteum TaxID=2547397 RepID=A0A4V3AQX9_9RHOB|nr:hypothetical protein [Antarcticimicrobium luteum]TDK44457.1 hypothetical protein E1832_15200 [Antarcticimicrobium luteum]